MRHSYRRESSLYPLRREKVKLAFQELSKQGLIAKMNFSCCNTCGNYEITTSHVNNPKLRNKKGYVFYHRQSHNSFKESGNCYLNYGAFYSGDDSFESTKTKEIGELIFQALKNQDLPVIWDKDPNNKILVGER